MKINLNIPNDNLNQQNESNNSYLDLILLNNILFGKTGIKIKKENKGKFTKYCNGKVTDECILKGKNSPNPSIRKQAVFAQNARAWKHQEGGNLIPVQDDIDFSGLFLDLEAQPSEYEKRLQESDLNNEFFVTPIDKPIKRTKPSPSTEQSTESSSWMNRSYDGGTGGTTALASGDVSHINTNVPEYLRTAIQPVLGLDFKLGGNPREGYVDCSRFASEVMRNLGKTAFGNCRDLWKQTQRVKKEDIQVGDLVFLHNTQPERFKSGVASHVAVVTDISDLANGKIGVAQANRTGTKSNYSVWDITKNNYLGAGRASSKMQYGGSITSLFVEPPTLEFKELSIVEENNDNDFLIKPIQVKESSKEDDAKPSETFPNWFTRVYNESDNPSQYSNFAGYSNFKKLFDEYLKSDPSAKKYERILTAIAKHESGFNSSVLNKGGYPAYGYFQFIENGKINNISSYTGLSVDEFRNNPQAQIKAAVLMVRNIERSFSQRDIDLASSKGYNLNALIQGAWLGGVGGVRNYLYKGIDSSDGSSKISQAMQRGNQVK